MKNKNLTVEIIWHYDETVSIKDPLLRGNTSFGKNN